MRAILAVAVTGFFALGMDAEVRVEKTEYKGWAHCYRVTNGEIELIVTGDVGPRIIRFGFVGGQNLFKEYAEQLGKSGEEKFQLRGGDRVWKAPEDPIATWAPDNAPVEIQLTPTGVIARGAGRAVDQAAKRDRGESSAERNHRARDPSNHQPFAFPA